jgi:hypothetical protein
VSGLLGPEDQKDLASLMMHSSATQQKVYNKCTNLNKKIRMSKILKSAVVNKEVTAADLAPARYGKALFFSI